jgi:hypothetical protein|tara:strand:- start:5698 stop:5988 length:291 start_codon:yes stop_codon:yes gene_type:complete
MNVINAIKLAYEHHLKAHQETHNNHHNDSTLPEFREWVSKAEFFALTADGETVLILDINERDKGVHVITKDCDESWVDVEFLELTGEPDPLNLLLA